LIGSEAQYLGSDAKTKGISAVILKSGGKGAEFGTLRGNLLMMLAFREMVNSSSFKHKLVKPSFVEMLAFIIDHSEDKVTTQCNDFTRATFGAVESISKHSKLLN
jgi:hypothetical protein